MAYRDRQTPDELLTAAIRWESVRASFWSNMRPELSKECRLRAEGHRLRLEMEQS